MEEPKIAIIYDRINKFGGAERVLQSLHALYPNAVFFTSVYDKNSTRWTHGWKIRTSFLQKIPFAKNHHEWFGWLMPLVFESFNLSDFSIIITVTSEAAKGITTRRDQLHLCYCLTPTRYLWSHTHAYEHGYLHVFKRLTFSWLRIWDYCAAQRPDYIIAISQRVSKRIQKYYRRIPHTIVHPPTDLSLQSHSTNENKSDVDRSYYLVVSRLIPYKRVDLVIDACKKIKSPLYVVGTGSEERSLQKMAKGFHEIIFTGFVSDEKLAQLYKHAQALICPQEEDFGIVSLEAQHYGVPVITYAKSGVAETIIDGITGVQFHAQTTQSLVGAIRKFETMQWNREKIREHASKFSHVHFENQMRSLVNSLTDTPNGK